MNEEIKYPHDLGFDPSKFPTFREHQLETAQEVVSSQKPLFLVEAPTGSGKSLLALTAHRLMGEPRTVYLVSTKQLQDQIEADFHIPVLKGRSNYPCLQFPKLWPEVTSEICKEYLGDDECEYASDCPYNRRKRKALMAPICVLNYPLFLTEANYVGKFSGLKYIILDEVDTLEDHLMNFIEVTITPRLLKRFDLGLPRYRTRPESWKEWIEKVKLRVEVEVRRMEPKETLPPVKLKDYVRLKRLHRRLAHLIDTLDENWVMEHEEDKGLSPVIFKPVKVSSFARNNLWDHTEKSLGMSATIMGAQPMALELGLHTWDVESANLPSPFPIDTRKVQYSPIANITHKTKDAEYPKLGGAVDIVLNKHPEEKVLIHAVSYDLRDFLMNHLRPIYHLLMTHNRNDRAIALERFKSYGQPVAFISPSMERGIDLPGDLCRVIIVAKVPYPNLASPQVNKRLHGFSDGNLWYARRTVRSLVQMTGRATRFQGDWSLSYILDSQFGHLVARNKHIFPAWWVQSVRSGEL